MNLRRATNLVKCDKGYLGVSSQSGVNEDTSLLRCYAVSDIQRTVHHDMFL
jgi:hypothetical protein